MGYNTIFVKIIYPGFLFVCLYLCYYEIFKDKDFSLTISQHSAQFQTCNNHKINIYSLLNLEKCICVCMKHGSFYFKG